MRRPYWIMTVTVTRGRHRGTRIVHVWSMDPLAMPLDAPAPWERATVADRVRLMARCGVRAGSVAVRHHFERY